MVRVQIKIWGDFLSQADIIFIEMCKDILENGFSSEGQSVRPKWQDGTPAHTKSFALLMVRFDQNFPS